MKLLKALSIVTFALLIMSCGQLDALTGKTTQTTGDLQITNNSSTIIYKAYVSPSASWSTDYLSNVPVNSVRTATSVPCGTVSIKIAGLVGGNSPNTYTPAAYMWSTNVPCGGTKFITVTGNSTAISIF